MENLQERFTKLSEIIGHNLSRMETAKAKFNSVCRYIAKSRGIKLLYLMLREDWKGTPKEDVVYNIETDRIERYRYLIEKPVNLEEYIGEYVLTPSSLQKIMEALGDKIKIWLERELKISQAMDDIADLAFGIPKGEKTGTHIEPDMEDWKAYINIMSSSNAPITDRSSAYKRLLGKVAEWSDEKSLYIGEGHCFGGFYDLCYDVDHGLIYAKSGSAYESCEEEQVIGTYYLTKKRLSKLMGDFPALLERVMKRAQVSEEALNSLAELQSGISKGE